jgi:hypothetical protein
MSPALVSAKHCVLLNLTLDSLLEFLDVFLALEEK